jgi:replicative DNA helicase
MSGPPMRDPGDPGPADEQEGFRNVERGTNRKPPCSDDAERAVIAAMLIDRQAILTAATVVTAEMFVGGRHRHLFRAIQAISLRDEVVDPLTVAHQLESQGVLKEAGGKDYLADLLDEIPTAANVAFHAEIVRGMARRRELMALGHRLQLEAAALDIPPETAFDRAAQTLLQLSTGSPSQGFRHVKKGVLAAMDRIFARRDGSEPPGLTTGFPELDDKMAGGPEPGSLVVVVGVPSSGKTSLVWCMLNNLAQEGRGTVAMVSAEMTEAMLLDSALAAQAEVPRERIRQSDMLTDGELRRLGRAAARMIASPVHVDDTEMPDVEDVVARCVTLKARYPDLTAIGVDFIQLLQLRSKGRGELQEAVLGHIAYQLKSLAKRLGVVVYAMAQPNDKQIEEREDKRPTLRDIQGTGRIRQAADTIMLLYRPGQYDANAGPEFEIHLAKNKFGSNTKVHLLWEGPFLRVTSEGRKQMELDRQRAEPAVQRPLGIGGAT